MIDGAHISQEDLALYALQALPAAESAELRGHLQTCADCRKELDSLLLDLAMVGMSVDQKPAPERLRQSLFARIAEENKAGAPAGPVLVARKGGGPAWVPWTIAAALLLAVTSLSYRVHQLHREIQDESQQAAQAFAANSYSQKVLTLLMTPTAQRVVLTVSKTPAEPTGHAIYLADRGELIFQGGNLRPLPSDKTYELWLIPANGKAPIPAGLFRPDTSGNASVVLPPIPAGVPAKAFGVTEERLEGSQTPTAPILLSGAAPGE